MNIGILGIRGKHLTKSETEKAMEVIVKIIKRFDNPKIATIHSPNGGINALVEMYATTNNLQHMLYNYGESIYDWKETNKKLVQDCDVFFCITTHVKKNKCHHCFDGTHETTGGCYPLKLAKEVGKPTKLIIL